jgi:type IV pilus assembly protein PilQ
MYNVVKKRLILLVTFATVFFSFTFSQDRFTIIESKLKELAVKDSPGLNDKVDLSVNGVSIQDFIRGIATTSNLNISIDPLLTSKVYNNFSNVTVIDVFIFLCKKNDLDIAFVGNIISFLPYNAPKPPPETYVPKEIKITFDKNTDFISLDLSNDSLYLVAKELTRITQKNIVFAPELSSKLLSGYILNMPFSKAMDQLSFANDIKISTVDDNVYAIEKKDKEVQAKLSQSKSVTAPVQGLNIKQEPNFHVSIDAVNIPIADIVANVSKELAYNYFLFSELKGNATMKVTNVTYDQFLTYVLNATDYTYRKQADLYMIGDRNIEGLRVTKLVQLKYRTIEKIVDFIPAELKKKVDMKIFPDLNGIILSGSQPSILEIESFIRDIDQIVPVITIEVMLVDVRNSKTLSAGIEAGIGESPKPTNGTLYPGVNLSLSSSAVNNIISGINGFGIVNLGSVTPKFYLTLKALETQGVLKLRSTPQLATLNGNEAKMSIGKTEYYPETQTTIIGNVTGGAQTATQWKSVNADLSLSINPIVSGNEQITLEIKVKQSSFTERISPNAPPGTITRDFSSLIRVKNQEMIMLGGLDENSVSDTGSGVPFLSRIPVLKWLFSSRTRAKSNNKLTVFIKPTVLY